MEHASPAITAPQRPFVCGACNTAFVRSDHLIRHMRMHTMEKPYPCLECEKAFARPDLLKRHARKHSPSEMEKPSRKRRRPRVSQACRDCAAAKARCDEMSPCSRCHRRGVTCVRVEADGVSSATDTSLSLTASHDDRLSPDHAHWADKVGAGTHMSGMREEPASIDTRHSLSTPRKADTEPLLHGAFLGDDSPMIAMGAGGYEAQTSVRARHVGRHRQQSRASRYENESDVEEEENLSPESRTRSHKEMSMAINLDPTSTRRQYLGSSSLQVFSQWLGLSFLALGPREPTLSSRFAHGMRFAVEFEIPLNVPLLQLPSPQSMENLFDIYFRRIHPLFPLLHQAEFYTLICRLGELKSQGEITSFYRPLLACVYAVLSIAADEEAGQPCAQGAKYLEAAYSLYAHLVALPYIPSVQALLLITIALCGRNKEGSSWHICGQAVRISQAIGIHRQRPRPPQSSTSPGPTPDMDELDARIWWVAFCLEKLHAFESGRPSMIVDAEIDQSLPQASYGGVDNLSAMVGLAKIQSRISTELFRMCTGPKSTDEILNETGILDDALQKWVDSLPDEIKPEKDLVYCSGDQFPFSAFISFQYHQTMITLHRAAMLLDPRLHQRHVERSSCEKRWIPRLRAGEALCVSSARCMIRVVNEMLHKYGQTRVLRLTQPLLATYVLAIQTIKHPEHWNSRHDFLLLENVLDYLDSAYKAAGIDVQFCTMLKRIRSLASNCINHAQSVQHIRPFTPTGRNHNEHSLLTSTTQVTGVLSPVNQNVRTFSEEPVVESMDKPVEEYTPESDPIWALSFGDGLLSSTYGPEMTADDMQYLFGFPAFDSSIDFTWT